MASDRRADLVSEELAPQQYYTVSPLPRLYPNIAFTQRIECGLTWSINLSSLNTNPGDQVHFTSITSGVFVWFINRGYTPPIHFAFVKHGTGAPNGYTGLRLWPVVPPTSHPYMDGTTLTWVHTAVPYAKTMQPDYSPNIENMFSRLRVISGITSLVADAKPIGFAGLAGRLSVGSFNDVRNVQQVYNPTSKEQPWLVYDDSVMEQQAIPKSCVETQVQQADGVVALVGPDIYPRLTSALPGKSQNEDAEWQDFKGTGFYGPSGTLNQSTWPAFTPVVIHAAWITPWNITLSNPSTYAVSGVSTQNIYYANGMNTCGTLDVYFNMVFQDMPASPAGQYPNTVFTISQRYCHVYAYCNNDGVIVYSTKRGERVLQLRTFMGDGPWLTNMEVTNTINDAHLGSQGIENGHISASGNNETFIADDGMYIGTQVVTYAMAMSPFNTSWTGNILGAASVNYRVQAHNLHGPGELGPIRVLKYTDISAGTLPNETACVRLKSTVHVEGEPYGTNASFVSDATLHEQQSTNDTLQNVLQSSYVWDHRDSRDIKRVNVMTHYYQGLAQRASDRPDNVRSVLQQVDEMEERKYRDGNARSKRYKADFDANPEIARVSAAKDVQARLRGLDASMQNYAPKTDLRVVRSMLNS